MYRCAKRLRYVRMLRPKSACGVFQQNRPIPEVPLAASHGRLGFPSGLWQVVKRRVCKFTGWQVFKIGRATGWNSDCYLFATHWCEDQIIYRNASNINELPRPRPMLALLLGKETGKRIAR